MSSSKKFSAHLIALEPRMMFDGAGVTTAIALGEAADIGSLDAADIPIVARDIANNVGLDIGIFTQASDVAIIAPAPVGDARQYGWEYSRDDVRIVPGEPSASFLHGRFLGGPQPEEGRLDRGVVDADSLRADLVDASVAAAAPTDYIFIDTNVENYTELAAEWEGRGTIVYIDHQSDGIDQMLAALAGRSDIGAIHIVSHGDDGVFWLGTTRVDLASVTGELASSLASVGSKLSADGDILIYGCDVGNGEAGQALVDALAAVTQADIAASVDDTGSVMRGGDWTLENRLGMIEATGLVAEHWEGLLATTAISAPPNSATVRDGNGVIVAQGSTGFTDFGSYSPAVGQGATATWANVGTVNGQSISLRATVVSLSPGDAIRFQRPLTGNDDPTIALFSGVDVTTNVVAQIRWDIFYTATGEPVPIDISYTVADIDGVGNVPRSREFITVETDTLTSFQAANGSDVLFDTSIPGEVTASGTINENGGVASAARFNWLQTSSFVVTYNLVPTASTNAVFSHDGDLDFNLGTGGTTVSIPRLDLDNNNSTAPGSAYLGTYVENSAGVSIVDNDVSVTNPDGSVQRATITLTNAQGGDQLLVNGSTAATGTLTGGITYTRTATQILLTGAANAAAYQNALKTITFESVGERPSEVDRKINITFANAAYTSNVAVSTIKVIEVNDPPTAVNDPLRTINEDTPITNLNVLANDFDGDGDPLTVTSATALNGAVTINADGTLNYTPNANYNGTDTITYTIVDGRGGTSTATVPIVITAVNDAPTNVGSLPSRANLDATTGISVPTAQAFTDVDNATLTYSAVGLPAGLTIDSATGVISGTIDNSASQAGAGGAYTIAVRATDAGGLFTTQNFSWSITNPAPIAVNDTASTTEDTPVTVAVLANDRDPDLDTLSLVSASAPNGTVVINPDGTLTYTPRANFDGTDTVTYTISDGEGGTATATVTVTIAPVNDAPTAVGSLPPQTNLDAASGINVPTAGGFTDVDNASLTYSAAGLPLGLTINSATGVITGSIDNSASQTGGGNYTVTVTATDAGNLSAVQTFNWNVTNPAPSAVNDSASTTEDTPVTVNVLANDTDPDGDTLTVTSASAPNGSVVINADGTLTYTPNANFSGTDTVTYTISDGEGGTSTATVTITIAAVNDAPVPVGSLPPQANLDAAAVISVPTASAFSDVDNAALTYSAAGLPAGLTIDSATGVISGTISNSASQGGAGGVYSVTVTATDTAGLSASQVFAWTVTNPAPIAVDDAASTLEDTAVLIDVLPNDSDPDGDTITLIAAFTTMGQATVVGNQINYVPPANFSGQATITYTISDGQGGESTAVATVTIAAVNDAPTATPIAAVNSADGATVAIPVAGNFADVDGDTLSFSAAGLPPGLTIDPVTGVISGTISPDASQTNGGVYTAVITVSDGNGGTVTQTIAFNVANPAPVAAADSATTDEDTPTTINVLANDTDPDGDPLTVTSADAQNGTVVINADGTITYTPNPGFNGSDTITYEISDGNGGTSIAVVTVTINDVNDPPVAVGTIGNQTNLDAQAITLPVAGAFSDPDGDALTYAATGLPAGLTIDPVTGVISGTIDNSASQVGGGTYAITVFADDGRGSTISQSFTWQVSNPAPVAANDSATTNEDAPVNIAVLANDVDPDGDTLTVTEASAGHGTVTINPDGTLVYTPNANFNGTDTIVYTISDGEGGFSSASVNVTITPVNDAPTTVGLPTQDGEDAATVSIPTATAFSDPDGDTLTFTATGLPDALSIDPATGLITGTLASDSSQRGPFVVTVTATDPSGAQVSTTFVYSVQNIPPVAVNDTAATPEDVPVTVAVLANDLSPDGDPLTITSASADNGTVVINPDGTLTFTPNANFNGQANVTYTISDGQGGIATATLTIDVAPVNDAPQTIDIPDVVNQDNQSVSMATASFFSDLDGDALTITAAGLPAGLTINPANGIISGTIDRNASQGGAGGVYTVTLTASDGNGGTVSQVFTWTVTNPAPTAANDTAATNEDAPVNITVLLNDTDPDGDALTITAASAPNGTVVIEADGTLTYTPSANFNGSDTITYTISDGNGGSSTAAVIVTVAPVNDAPVAVNDSVTTDEDTPVVIGVLGNDSDVDGDTLTVTSATSPNGTVTINPDGTLLFTPAANFNGPATITYTISDGNGGTATATVSVSVNAINDAPVAAPDAATTPEDTPVNIPLIGNDTDADGDSLTVTSAAAPNGTVVINPDGSVDYTPNPDFNGTDTITYTISDGNGGFATSTVTVTVSPVNDAPVAAPLAPQTGDDSTPVSLDVSGAFSDVDGDTLSYTAAGLPPGLAIDANGLITGTLAADASQGGPLGDGVYTVTVTASDGNGGTVTTTFMWAVNNPAPLAADDAATTDEDTPVNIAVLANDNDPDGDPLTVVSATAANGTVVIEADGTVTYTPAADFNGTDTITYQISDGNGGTSTAIVTVTVNPVNDAPVATPIAAQNNVDSAVVSIPVAANFADTDANPLTFSASGLPAGLTIDPATGVISGTIDRAASQVNGGVYTVTVTADDGEGGTVSTTFSWSVTNPAPVAQDDAAATNEDTPVNIAVLANDSDPDGDPLTVVSANAANGTVVIEADGTITYTPNANFNGTDTVTYQISDGNGGTQTATVTVTVAPVNDTPTVDTPLPNLNSADSTAVSVPVAGNFSDLDADTLTFTATGLPAGLTIDANGVISGTIDPSASQGGPASDGIYIVTVTADDGFGGTVSTSFAWTVTNPPPVAANDTATSNEDTPVDINVLANDTDPDGDTLTVVSASAVNGTVVINADGTVTYTPAANFNGTDTITYQITDSEGGTSTATVTVTVNPVNDSPVADPQLTNQTDVDAGAVSVDVSGNFADVDGDTLTFTATGLPGGLSIDANGLITGTLDADASQGGPAGGGLYTVTITADDGNGGTVTSTFVWTVTNPAPAAAPDIASTNEDTPVTVAVLANDNDPDGDALTVIAASATNGTVTINPDGTVTYTPKLNFNGTDTVVYTISDGQGGTSTSFVTITVNPVNDAPVTFGLPNLTDGNNEAISVPLAPAFSDADDTVLVYAATGLPAGLSIDPVTGQVTGTTSATASTGGPGGNGIYTVTVRATDPSGQFVETTFTWTINNQPPTAIDDTYNGFEDTPQILDVLANDNDPDGNAGTPIVIIAATATHGTALVNADGTILFTPDANFNGTATVTYTIQDANGDPASAIATIIIAPVNDAPSAAVLPNRADLDGAAITFDAAAAFSDIEGDTLTFTAANLPDGLSIDLLTGQITGTISPDASQIGSGVYQTTITANDGNGGTTDVTFVWTVTNPAPTAGDDTASASEDTPSAPIAVLANDIDPDLDNLTVTAASAPNGTVVINGDGTLTYTPDANFNGTDTITYSISDGQGGTSTAIVTVTVGAVNDAPTAPPLSSRSNVDADVISLDVSGGFADADGDILSFSAAGLPDGLTIDTAGTITGTITAAASQGGPAGDGIYQVTITAIDGNGGTVSTTFSWTATNPPPQAVADGPFTTPEVTALDIAVLANDTDPDGDPLTVTLASAGNGTVVINADGTLTYTPDANFNGTDTISYQISDGNGGVSSATVSVTVSPVNDDPAIIPLAPRANVDSASVSVSVAANFADIDGDTLVYSAAGLPGGLTIDRATGVISGTIDSSASQVNGGIYTVTITAEDGNGGTADNVFVWAVTNPQPTAVNDTATTTEDSPVNIAVLGNDTDPDGDTLSVITAIAANGSVTIRPDGTIDYTPNANFNGTDTITYTISDGDGGVSTATVTVTVVPANDPPVAVNDATSTGEDTPVTIAVLGNDTDIDGDALSVVAASAANGTVVVNADGTITYTPNANFNGTDTVTYTISDGNGGTDTATVTIVVAAVNDNPVALDDAATTPEDTPVTIAVLGNDSDVDADPLSVTAATSPDGTVAINPDGTILFTPNANFNGPATIAYTISDGNGGTAAATVTVTVVPVNDPPVAVNDAVSTSEDTPVTVPVLANDTDPENDPLTVTAATAANGTAVINPDGTVTYTPNPNFNGVDTIVYSVSDGNGGTSTASVTVTVTPINDPPVAANDTAAGTEDVPLIIAVLGNDTDADGDPLTVTAASSPDGTVTINPDGTVTFVPVPNFNGPTVIPYTITDGNGGTSTATVAVTIAPVNDAPIAQPDAAITDEDTPVTLTPLANDSDVDGDPLTIIAASAPNGTVVINPDGTVTYTPNANFNGTDIVTYQISDGNGGFATATITVTVTPVNDAPVAANDTAAGTEDTPVTIPVLGNDTDPEGDPLTVVAASSPDGTVTINPDGTITFIPAPNFNGSTIITYTISDGNGGTSTATVAVTIAPVNDLPTDDDEAITVIDGSTSIINVLANAADPDGDTLSVIIASVDFGSVAINPDGTLTYVAPIGFSGDVMISYTISDGNGGLVSSVVTITVTGGAGDINFLLDQYRSPSHPDGWLVDRLLDQSDQFISTPLIILETVNDFRSLRGLGTLNVDQPLLNAVNGLRTLNCIGGFELGRHPIDAVVRYIDHIRDLRFGLDNVFDPRFGDFIPQSLTGFSVRQLDTGTDQVMIEAIARERVIYLEMRDIGADSDPRMVEYQLLTRDGSPLPDWIRMDQRGLAIIERPLDEETIRLIVRAIRADGQVVEMPIVVQGATGEIQLDDPAGKQAANAHTLHATMARANLEATSETESLLAAFRG